LTVQSSLHALDPSTAKVQNPYQSRSSAAARLAVPVKNRED
jgi:hypothetical protein